MKIKKFVSLFFDKSVDVNEFNDYTEVLSLKTLYNLELKLQQVLSYVQHEILRKGGTISGR